MHSVTVYVQLSAVLYSLHTIEYRHHNTSTSRNSEYSIAYTLNTAKQETKVETAESRTNKAQRSHSCELAVVTRVLSYILSVLFIRIVSLLSHRAQATAPWLLTGTMGERRQPQRYCVGTDAARWHGAHRRAFIETRSLGKAQTANYKKLKGL